jgi:hypothetical protein
VASCRVHVRRCGGARPVLAIQRPSCVILRSAGSEDAPLVALPARQKRGRFGVNEYSRPPREGGRLFR